MSRIMKQARGWWQAEAERRFLWLPILFACGIAIYFALPQEPKPQIVWQLMAAGAVLVSAARYSRYHRLFVPSVCLFVITLGLLAASLHTARHTQPLVAEAIFPRPTEGTVEEIERTEHGVRFTLTGLSIAGLEQKKTPERIRISVRPKAGHEIPWPHMGDRISIRAGLMPPMGPALPHGFDFSRYFFFRDIGAVGYGLPPWNVVESEGEPTLKQQFLDWRFTLTDRIIDTLGAERGPIASGLITGEARAISEADFDALKASNLYHIIAISGGHMVVIAGVIFVGLRLLLLALPGGWAQRQRGKTLTAFITLVLTTLYLAVTGMPISAVRAYVMIVLVLLAVIFGRRGDPMRALMLTFWLMLILDPSDLFEPGFQLSFAATLAIVALVEAMWFRPPVALEEGWFAVAFRLFWLSLLITVAAQFATTPIAIAMFNNFSTYGLLANLIATPLVTFFLMPAVALFFLLLPLGLESFALALIDLGIQALLAIARWNAGLPSAQVYVPSLPGWGVALFALGLSWFCLWLKRPRLLGIPLMVAGSLSLLTVTLPDLLIGVEARQIAVRTSEGFVLAKGRASAMIPELWAHGVGQAKLLTRDKKTSGCLDGVCQIDASGTAITFPKSSRKPIETCVPGDIIVARQPMVCEGQRVIPAAEHIQAVWFYDGRLETSGDWQGNRPWRAIPAAEDGE